MSQKGKDDLQQVYERVLAVKRAHEAELMAKANVVGVGVGFRQRRGVSTGQVALVVMVRTKIPASELAPQDRIPQEIETVPVDVLAVGEIRAQGS